MFIVTKLEGHYGNEIILLKARLDAKKATELIYHIIDSLNIYDKKRLIDDLDHYIDRNSLYIRLNKQDLFRDRIAFGDDGIKIKFKVKGFKPEIEFDVFKKVLSERDG